MEDSKMPSHSTEAIGLFRSVVLTLEIDGMPEGANARVTECSNGGEGRSSE